jgi:hypothetical protein
MFFLRCSIAGQEKEISSKRELATDQVGASGAPAARQTFFG